MEQILYNMYVHLYIYLCLLKVKTIFIAFIYLYLFHLTFGFNLFKRPIIHLDKRYMIILKTKQNEMN